MITFVSAQAKKNFYTHLSRASFLVRFFAKVGIAISRASFGHIDKLPLINILVASSNSLVKMHNYSAKSGVSISLKKSHHFQVCDYGKLSESQKNLDLLIVGSGPGGAVEAKFANDRKINFLIVEKGFKPDKTIPSHSVSQMYSGFRNGGQEVIISMPPIPFAQGETIGGGSSVNSGLYHNLPSHVKKDWLAKAKIEPKLFDDAELLVYKNLKIHEQGESTLGIYRDSPLKNMKSFLGWEGGVIPRWRKYKTKNDYEHFGMNETYLLHVHDRNILSGHEVVKLKSINGGVTVKLKGKNCKHELFSKKICLSAGTIGTPEILVKSKLAKQSDFIFKFHAMIRQVAFFEREVNDLKDIDPHQIWSSDYEFKIGAAVSTPELLEATFASKGIEFNGDLRKVMSFYISIPSDGKGSLLKIGNHLIPFFVPSRHMRAQVKKASDILQKAVIDSGGEIIGAEKLSISSVHIFGSIPLGESKLIDNLGYLKGSSKKIYVSDASLLPTHPVVNPQGPLMHLVTAIANMRSDSCF